MDEEDIWTDCIVLKKSANCVLVKVTSNALMFKMKANHFQQQRIQLISEMDYILNVELKQTLSGIVISIQRHPHNKESEPLDIIMREYQTFWISWFNGCIQIGKIPDYKPLLSFEVDTEQILQYARFNRDIHSDTELAIYVSPISNIKPDYKILDGEDLRWEPVENNVLPLDAIVGGFEGEPLYIARANHNNSLCPGKYVKSRGMAFVPWGGREHAKTEFMVLCGYDYQWVKSKHFNIPENAFVAGQSEHREDPLYIARAKHCGYVIPGKVHVRYGTCYLPFEGREVEVGDYEILVRPSVIARGRFINK